jgi:hypothetical protein
VRRIRRRRLGNQLALAGASRATGARCPLTSGCEKQPEGGVTIVRECARVSDRLQMSAVGFLLGSAPFGCG